MRPPAVLASALLLLALAGCGGQSPAAEMAATSSTVAPAATVTQADTQTIPATGTATATVPGTTTAPATNPVVAPEAPRPSIHQWPIPFPAARRHQMAAYSLRHYSEDTYVLSHPKVIVEHYTETATAGAAFNTFAADVPDNEFHELPNTCAHFLVEPSGRIDQLVPPSIRCRHTTGLNWTAIGIENVGFSDQAILGDHAQIAASLKLTRWLRCRYGITLNNVIGHSESLSSPYHHDRVPAFQHQTHSDWSRADMSTYRHLLARTPCPT